VRRSLNAAACNDAETVGPTGFTFNQFLVDAEEPLLFHAGMRTLFLLVSAEIARIMPVVKLRWITFGHVEADECGAMRLPRRIHRRRPPRCRLAA
jgi:flavorubredoxin